MSSLQIETYSDDALDPIADFYNAQTAFEPHIAPLTPERFQTLAAAKSAFDPDGLFIARAGGDIVGWIHACIAPGSEPWHPAGKAFPRIRMFLYRPDALKAGAALVQEATAYLEKRAPGQEIEALHAQTGYPFYRGLWLGGEPMGHSALAQVHLALETAGYKNTQESVFMTATLTDASPLAEPDAPLDFVTGPAEMRHDGMAQSWIGFEPRQCVALFGEEKVGSISYVIIPYLADKLGAAGMNIFGLGVSESRRRQGIANALVTRALADCYAQGARFASVGTQLWNTAAHATYVRCGFVPHLVMVGRARKLETPE